MMNQFCIVDLYLKCKATGHHFSTSGHSMADMSVSVIERIRSSDPFYRKVRESHWIEQFESLRKGINRKR